MSRPSSRRALSIRKLNGQYETYSKETELDDSEPRYRVVRMVPVPQNKRPGDQNQELQRPRTIPPRSDYVVYPSSRDNLRRRHLPISDYGSSYSSDDDSETTPDERKVIRYRRIMPSAQRGRYSFNDDNRRVIQPARRTYVRNVPKRGMDDNSKLSRSDGHRMTLDPYSRRLTKDSQRTPIYARFPFPEHSVSKRRRNLAFASPTQRNSLDSETSSDSSHDYSDSDSSNSEYSESFKQSDKTSPSTALSGKVLLDYSKMLKSREEQRNYELERKKHEEDVNIVRLVQKEVNKAPPRRKLSCGCRNPPEEIKKVDNEKHTLERNSNELVLINNQRIHSKNDNTTINPDHVNTIKEKVRESEERRMLSERRNRVEVLGEREYLFRKEKDETEIKNRPSLQDLDVCRPPKIYPTKHINEPDNIEVKVKYDVDFDAMYPKPRPKGCQEIYYIDLTKPTEKVEPKPFDVFERRIVPQPKKQYEGLVKVGGGWNTMNHYMERHSPVKKFVYNRNLPEDSSLPKSMKEFYGFNSKYKYPNQPKKVYRSY